MGKEELERNNYSYMKKTNSKLTRGGGNSIFKKFYLKKVF